MRTTSSRFEVSRPDCGVIEHVGSKFDAYRVAKNFCFSNGFDYVEVFDRMARLGDAQLWRLNVYYFISGTEVIFYHDWKVVECRALVI